MHNDMRHLNGDMLCAIDIKTTGPDPEEHDIVEVCILPLDANLKYSKQFMPFLMQLKPRYPENVDKKWMTRKCKLKLSDYMTNGMDYFQSAVMFDAWFEKLQRKYNKRIQPLAYEWSQVKPFLVEWIGKVHVEDCFDWRVRNILSCALRHNDHACFRAEPYPLPKVDTQYLTSKLKIHRDNPKDVLDNCKVYAEIYKRLIFL